MNIERLKARAEEYQRWSHLNWLRYCGAREDGEDEEAEYWSNMQAHYSDMSRAILFFLIEDHSNV